MENIKSNYDNLLLLQNLPCDEELSLNIDIEKINLNLKEKYNLLNKYNSLNLNTIDKRFSEIVNNCKILIQQDIDDSFKQLTELNIKLSEVKSNYSKLIATELQKEEFNSLKNLKNNDITETVNAQEDTPLIVNNNKISLNIQEFNDITETVNAQEDIPIVVNNKISLNIQEFKEPLSNTYYADEYFYIHKMNLNENIVPSNYLNFELKNSNAKVYINPKHILSVSSDIYLDSNSKQKYYFNIYNGTRNQDRKKSLTIQCNNIAEADKQLISIFTNSPNPEIYIHSEFIFYKHLFRYFLRYKYNELISNIYKYYYTMSSISDLKMLILKKDIGMDNWYNLKEIEQEIEFYDFLDNWTFKDEIVPDKDINKIQLNFQIMLRFEYGSEKYQILVSNNTLNSLKRMSKLKNQKHNKLPADEGYTYLTNAETNLKTPEEINEFYNFIKQNKWECFYKFLPEKFI